MGLNDGRDLTEVLERIVAPVPSRGRLRFEKRRECVHLVQLQLNFDRNCRLDRLEFTFIAFRGQPLFPGNRRVSIDRKGVCDCYKPLCLLYLRFDPLSCSLVRKNRTSALTDKQVQMDIGKFKSYYIRFRLCEFLFRKLSPDT